MPTLKVLDSDGLKYLWSKINMQDYPNNDVLTDVINAINVEIETIRNSIYPVGSIYLSVNEIEPSQILGFGVWEQIKDTFLLAAGNNYPAGSIGGETEHVLTIKELAKHTHALKTDIISEDYDVTWAPYYEYNEGWVQGPNTETSSPATYTTYTGESEPHNNMPPYLAVYMWKRIE